MYITKELGRILSEDYWYYQIYSSSVVWRLATLSDNRWKKLWDVGTKYPETLLSWQKVLWRFNALSAGFGEKFRSICQKWLKTSHNPRKLFCYGCCRCGGCCLCCCLFCCCSHCLFVLLLLLLVPETLKFGHNWVSNCWDVVVVVIFVLLLFSLFLMILIWLLFSLIQIGSVIAEKLLLFFLLLLFCSDYWYGWHNKWTGP